MSFASAVGKAVNIVFLGVPGLLMKALTPDIPSQKLGELSAQTAKESEPRAIIWGRVRPIGGNLIHCQAPVKKMIKESTGTGGKGGSSSKKTKVEHVFRTYALGVCEGPITAYARIWRNNKLVYDGRGTEWGRANNGVFLKSYRLYLGLWTQMPSPDLEAIWGVGNVPAYRGTAYMVALNEDLTDMSGAVPQWQFEVERAEGYPLTSRPYAVEVVEALQSNGQGVSAPWQGFTEALGSGGSRIADGTLRSILNTYTVADGLGSAGSTISEGSLRQILKNYALAPEAIASGGSTIASGSLRQILITYTYTPEAIGSGGQSLVSGTLA